MRLQVMIRMTVPLVLREIPPAAIHCDRTSDAELSSSGDDVTFWSGWNGNMLVAVGALKRLSSTHGEIKSMYTVQTNRRSGVGTAMLRHIMDSARTMGMTRLSLETGSWAYFHPARALYRSHGFVDCPPFGEYVEDPNSIFMTLDLPKLPSGGDYA